MNKERMMEINVALQRLGFPAYITGIGTEVKPIDEDRAEVFMQGDRIGIYDFIRHTFVD